MTRSPEDTALDRVRTGWAELANARWGAARDQFSEALAANETAESCEGLSWAAWWLDDAPTVFDARERAYRLYRARGDIADAARMATWLAVDELDFHGATSVASGWLRRAHRLLDPLEPGPAHGWLSFQEGYLAYAAGNTEAARTLALAAAELGRRHRVADLEMLGLALEGAALVACAEVHEGMERLDEATTIALGGDATIPISSAWTCCFLVSACMAVFDLRRAVEWCDRIAAFAERYGSRYMLAFCRAEYGAVAMARGEWRDAEALLEASVDDFSSSRPAWVTGPLTALAELRRRQGRRAEAGSLLEQAGSSQAAQLCSARIALDSGDAVHAGDLVERLLRRTPEHRQLDRAPVLELLAHARLARGDFDQAAAALEELRSLSALTDSPVLEASTCLLEGVVSAGRGEHERARSLLEDAVDRYAECGTPFECACARIELATSLRALGREDTARREASAALEGLVELGAVGQAERAQRILDGGRAPAAGLTSRECEVLVLVAEGLTNRQIAERLVLSEHTVHRHMTNLLRKLDLPSRTAAAAYAVRAGIVESTA